MLKKITIALTIIFVIGMTIMFNIFAAQKGVTPQKGFVPDEETAQKIAEAIWYPIYGDNIYNQKPFTVEFDAKSECWIVKGTLPKNTLGGVAEISINKKDGQIQYVYHSK